MKFNLHHTLPSSKGGIRHRNNLIKLPEHTHTNFHRIFGNDDVKEQIERILALYNPNNLTDEFRADIMKVLEVDDYRYFYKNGIYQLKQ